MPVTWNRLLFPDVSDSAAKNGTNIIVRDEVKIETVIIILWVAGGALLLTLLILLVCILRNNKKTGAQCGTGSTHVLRIDPRRANPRDGRLNHGYSNYDEIWTWIPIIRGTEGDCARSSVYATPSSNDIRPPSYNEVVGSSSTRAAGAATNQSAVRAPRLVTPSPNNPVSISISATNTSLSPNPATSTREARNTEDQPQGQNVQNCSGRTSGRNVSVHSADFEHNTSRNTASTNQEGEGLQTLCNRLQDNEINRGNTTQHNVRTNQYLHLASAGTPNGSNANGFRMRDSEDDYRDVIYHADQGLYSFVTSEGGRRAWCDIPPSLLNEDGPPPYTPAPDYPGRHHNTRRTSYRQAVNDTSPRYSRRNRRCRELPPDYPVTDQGCALGRSEQNRGSISAPIVRCDYEYF